MKDSIVARLSKPISWKIVLLALAIFVVFLLLFAPQQSQNSSPSARNIGSPDTTFFYSAAELADFADSYGEEGRADYIRTRWRFDLVFPLVYTFFLWTAIRWIYSIEKNASRRLQFIALVPLAGALLDYFENTATSYFMFQHPPPIPIVAIFAALFSSLKWLFIFASFGLLFWGIISRLFQSLRK
jgi:hypothetical protein